MSFRCTEACHDAVSRPKRTFNLTGLWKFLGIFAVKLAEIILGDYGKFDKLGLFLYTEFKMSDFTLGKLELEESETA